MKADNLIILYTGNGKGKTTAALGLMWRALGHGMKCGVVQFIKKDSQRCGEYLFAQQQRIEWNTFGEGFTWLQKDPGPSREAAQRGWKWVTQVITEKRYDLLILDEFTYPLHENWISEDEVIQWLLSHREKLPHIVITGREASPYLIQISDIATEMQELQHCFSTSSTRAAKGIEF